MLDFLRLFRFPLVLTAVADVAAGYLLARRGAPVGASTLVLLAVASAGLYCFGMATNDLADRRRDLELHPGRVLPSGRLSPRRAWLAAGGMLALSLAAVLLAPGAERRIVAWGGVVALIFVYNFIAKLAPLMGAIRALNFVMGAGLWPFVPAVAPFVYVTGLTFVSTLEEKPSKSLLGTWVSVMIAGAALPVFFGVSAWPVSVLLAGWIVYRAWGARDRKGIMRLVREGLCGLFLLDGALLASAGLFVEAALAVFLLLPTVLMIRGFRHA